MKQLRFWGFLPAFCLLALPLQAQQSRNELKLGTGEAKFGSVADVPLTLSTTDQVQGLVAAFEWGGATGQGVDLVAGPALATANTVVRRVGANFMVLGVVVDSDGVGGEIINPGNNQLVATAKIRCGPDPNPTTPGDETLTPVTFADGKYAAVNGGPLLDNIVVVGGLSLGATEGLILTNGSLHCLEGFNRYHIEAGAHNSGGRCGDAKVLMDNLGNVEGYVVSLCHDPAKLTLDSIAMGAAATAQSADFSASEIFPTGGTLGVVIDLLAPFSNATIAVGENNHIATYRYCCTSLPQSCTAPAITADLTFCDNVLGTPLKENVIVIGGLSVSPKHDEVGTFTCNPVGTQELCGDGIDNDCDGVIDNPSICAPATQMFACGSRKQADDIIGTPGALSGTIDTTVEVSFFYMSPEDNVPGHAQRDHIQGFSMALSYCCDISAHEVFDITGTIVAAVGAEFVSIQADNDATAKDGDGCELIIGVLVDALPPFDGATLPPTDKLQRVGSVLFDITKDPARCGTCCPIKFQDGVNGRGKVPIKNLISVENVSVSPQKLDCELCIVGEPKFFRGDCNFSRMGSMSVDIADAAAVVSYLFIPGTWKFQPPCLDACDCNDDGRIDLADAVCILQYLFQRGRFPLPPGPGFDAQGNSVLAGPDPTEDKIDCQAGGSCP